MTVKNLKYGLKAFLLLVSVNSMAQDGVVDTSFGTNGVVKTNVNNRYDAFSALTVQSDGKIIVVGNVTTGTDANAESIIVRYNVNGSLDTTFGTNGKIVAAFSTSYDTLNAVEVQADGKIVVAGYTGLDFLTARYTTSGQLDSSFGTNGVVVTNYYTTIVGSTQDRINCIAIQADGKILVGGYVKYYDSYPFAIARYNINGTLDATFGIGGRTIIGHNFNLSSGSKEIYDMVLTPSGKIYAVGKAKQTFNAAYTDQVIVRFNSDGSLDSTFAINGVRYFSTSTDSVFNDIKIQDDGKLVIVGNRGVVMSIVRLSENAVLDTTFSSDGRDTPLLPSLGTVASFGKSVCIQADGKIIMSGNLNGFNAAPQSVVLRYLPNGDLDPAFANAGIFNFFVGDEYQGGSWSAFQPNGKLIVGGDFNDSITPTADLYLFRISAAELATQDFSGSSIISYPNPVKNKLFIEAIEDYDITYRLFTVDGKEVKTNPAQHTSEDIVEIDVSHLTKGVYILSIEEKNIRKIKKIIKE